MSDKNTSTSGEVLKEDQSAVGQTGGGGGDHGGNKKRTTSDPPTLDNTTATEQQDHAKKQRKGDEPVAAAASGGASSSTAAAAAAVVAAATGDTSEEEGDNSSPHPVVWDLESALHQVTTNADNKAAPIEYLDDSEKAWVTFRLGHAGDASTLVTLYRTSKARYAAIAAAKAKAAKVAAEKAKQGSNNKGEDEAAGAAAADDDGNKTAVTVSTTDDRPISSQEEAAATKNLEAWLADGLGDDNKNPPAVFALIAEMECTPDAEAASAVKPVLKEESEDDDDDIKEKATTSSTTTTTPKRLVGVSILTIAPGTAFHKVTGKQPTSTEHDIREVQQAAAAAAQDANKAQEKLQRAVQEGKRHLRVEWLYTVCDGANDKDLTPDQLELHKLRISMSEKRHFLRLAALAVMTKSQLILVDHGANIRGSSCSSNSHSNITPLTLS